MVQNTHLPGSKKGVTIDRSYHLPRSETDFQPAVRNVLSIVMKTILSLRNGPDKNESNNGNAHVGLQKRANLSIVCSYF